jgi:hypothetical protein
MTTKHLGGGLELLISLLAGGVALAQTNAQPCGAIGKLTRRGRISDSLKKVTLQRCSCAGGFIFPTEHCGTLPSSFGGAGTTMIVLTDALLLGKRSALLVSLCRKSQCDISRYERL